MCGVSGGTPSGWFLAFEITGFDVHQHCLQLLWITIWSVYDLLGFDSIFLHYWSSAHCTVVTLFVVSFGGIFVWRWGVLFVGTQYRCLEVLCDDLLGIADYCCFWMIVHWSVRVWFIVCRWTSSWVVSCIWDSGINEEMAIALRCVKWYT